MNAGLPEAIMKAVDEKIDEAYMEFRQQAAAEYAPTTAKTYLHAVDQFRRFLRTGELPKNWDR